MRDEEEEREHLLRSQYQPRQQSMLWLVLSNGLPGSLALCTGVVLLWLQQDLVRVFELAVATGLLTTCSRSFFLPFLMCVGVLLWHSYDYRRGSLRVEVPMDSVLPSWGDMQRYGHYVHIFRPNETS